MKGVASRHFAIIAENITARTAALKNVVLVVRVTSVGDAEMCVIIVRKFVATCVWTSVMVVIGPNAIIVINCLDAAEKVVIKQTVMSVSMASNIQSISAKSVRKSSVLIVNSRILRKRERIVANGVLAW